MLEHNDKEGLGPIEGVLETDPKGWHIRLTRRIGAIETWALWNTEGRQSSNMPKDVVRAWMFEEQLQSIAGRSDD